jgi:hypothetical protein
VQVPTLNLKSLTTLVSNQVAAIQASSATLIDFSVGSVLRAVVEANAGVGMWLQSMILNVLAVARLATSFGADVDSFIADYFNNGQGMQPRLAAAVSNGTVTFSRYNFTQSAFIPAVGGNLPAAQCQSGDGTQTFNVVPNAGNSYYNATLNGYVVPAATQSVTVSVQSVGTGAATNVIAGAITRILTSMSNIDYCSNTYALAGGQSGETDAAVKARFVLFMLGLSRGNLYGIESALANMNVSIAYKVVDQYQVDSVFTPGFFYVVVDDGSGSPPTSFLNAASSAINTYRALGIQFAVIAPTLTNANVNMTLVTAPGYTHLTVAAQASALITQNIQALGLGNALPYSLVSYWAMGVPGVVAVDSYTLNSGTADLAANPQVRYMPSTITVS